MKLFSTSHIFPFPWQTLTSANWRKYPNEKAQHVVSCDVIDRYVDKNGVLYTERLIQCRQPTPSFLRRLFSQSPNQPNTEHNAFFREISLLDPVGQEYEATTINLSMTNICIVEEQCSFKPDPACPTENTLFIQRGHVTASVASFSISALGRLVEEAAVSRFYANADKGQQALTMVVDRLMKETKECFESSLHNVQNGILLDHIKREMNDSSKDRAPKNTTFTLYP